MYSKGSVAQIQTLSGTSKVIYTLLLCSKSPHRASGLTLKKLTHNTYIDLQAYLTFYLLF